MCGIAGIVGTEERDRSVQMRRMRDALLVVECALAALLLVGASLLGRSFVRLASVDAGYDPRNVLIARVYTPQRQRLGARASRISASLGLGELASSATAEMTMPLVQ